jgi:hypothetical protein
MSARIKCKCLKNGAVECRPILRAIKEKFKCNYNAFNGYHYTPSNYSTVVCMRCGGIWRSKAEFVNFLLRIPYEDFFNRTQRGNRRE